LGPVILRRWTPDGEFAGPRLSASSEQAGPGTVRLSAGPIPSGLPETWLAVSGHHSSPWAGLVGPGSGFRREDGQPYVRADGKAAWTSTGRRCATRRTGGDARGVRGRTPTSPVRGGELVERRRGSGVGLHVGRTPVTGWGTLCAGWAPVFDSRKEEGVGEGTGLVRDLAPVVGRFPGKQLMPWPGAGARASCCSSTGERSAWSRWGRGA